MLRVRPISEKATLKNEEGAYGAVGLYHTKTNMLIYSTRFRVIPAFDKKCFVDRIIEWNKKGSNPIEDIETDSFSFIAGDDNNFLEVTDLEEENVIAARIHIDNNGGMWNTDVVFNYAESVLSVYVNRTVSEDTHNPSAYAFAPLIVTQIIDNGYADKSMGIPISNKAICIDDRETVLSAISSSDRFSLPMVYLSSRSELNADRLAAKLSGLALVVSDHNDCIADKYPEPIYVFYPHRNMAPTAFDNYPFHRDIQCCVENYLNSREYRKLETWDGIQNERTDINNRNLLHKYSSVSSDNEILGEMYSELESKMAEAAELRDKLSYENNMLIAENARLRQENERFFVQGVPLLMRGNETDLYNNEQYEIIIDILKEYLAKSTVPNSRRADIILSVLEANHADGTPEKYRTIIRNTLDGYKNFSTAKITKALRDVGIEIIEHTGHYKIALKGDHRYSCEAAATCSDSRGGLNLVAEVNNTMF